MTTPSESPAAAPFADVLAANADYVRTFRLKGLAPVAASGVAVVTCMDSRIEPLSMLGLKPGDAKILRNAGARVTDDVLRTLTLATHLLGVSRIMVMPHTRCKMGSVTEDQITAEIAANGVDATSIDFGVVEDQQATLVHDVERVRHWPFLAAGVSVGGFIYDVDSGEVRPHC